MFTLQIVSLLREGVSPAQGHTASRGAGRGEGEDRNPEPLVSRSLCSPNEEGRVSGDRSAGLSPALSSQNPRDPTAGNK